jgi:hypothetical protein
MAVNMGAAAARTTPFFRREDRVGFERNQLYFLHRTSSWSQFYSPHLYFTHQGKNDHKANENLLFSRFYFIIPLTLIGLQGKGYELTSHNHGSPGRASDSGPA